MITKEFILENKDKWEEYKKEINELDKDILRDLIIEEPDIIDFINLDKLNGWDIYTVLLYCPGLVKDLKPFLDKLTEWDIYWVLRYRPGLIKDLKPYLGKLNEWYISRILKNRPGLIKYLEPYLDGLDNYDISWILRNRPEFSLLLKYLNTEYEDAAYYYTCPSEISKLDEEEKQELSKKMVELIRKEKK